MKFSIGIASNDLPFMRTEDRPHRSHLHGVVKLDGLSVVIGANSTGKTALLENIEQALERGWRPRSDQRLYRPQRAQRELILELDMTPGTGDVAWLERLRIGTDITFSDEQPLGDLARERGTGMPRVIAELVHDLLADDVDQVSASPERWSLDEEVLQSPLPSVELLEQAAMDGRFVAEFQDELIGLHLVATSLGEPAESLMSRSAFAVLDEVEFEAIVPPVVSASAEAADVSALAEACISTLIDHWFGISLEGLVEDPTDLPPRHPWISQDEFDRPQLALGARATAGVLQAAVAALLPPFVKTEGSFRLEVLEPERWSTGRSVIAGFARGRRLRRAETSGSGTRRWLALCLELATASLKSQQLAAAEPFASDERVSFEFQARQAAREERWKAGFRAHDLLPSSRPKPILLFDEPELHLHPVAQREAGQWLTQRLIGGDVSAVVAATHAPTLLGATPSGTRVLSMQRSGERTEVRELTGDMLTELDALATTAGLGREAWLFFTRAVLVVEGWHDRQILERFFGEELGRWRCRLLVLDGTKNSNRLLDSEFLGESGLPLFVLFDNVRLDKVRHTDDGERLSDEERQVSKLLNRSQEHDLTFLPYEEPDILCALPRVAVERRFDRHAFEKLRGSDDYWTDEINAWRAEIEPGHRKSFKNWIAQDRLGLSPQTDLVAELTRRVEPGDLPSPALRRAMRELEIKLSAQDLDGL